MAEAAEQRARARIGTTIRGKYRIEGLLATGSMACVYSATHRNASRVALKVLHPHLARDPAMRERFRREGYFANTIAHPGVPRAIDDDDTEDGCAFIVMELLEGETLEQRRLRMGGKLPLPFVLTVADTVLETLGAAHKHKILHRDMKPDNVFITFAGEVKLLDFGVARWDDGQSSSDMTAAGMVVGTPAFMPPEQALGKREEVDAQSDLWAFGATMFVVIAGQTVHAGGDAKARLIATARTHARKLQEVAPFVPRGVAAVVDRALSFEKRDRWPDALAMREALRWARRSLDAFALDSANEGELHRRPSSLYPGPPSTTRTGYYHEEPTVRGLPLVDDEGGRPEEDEPTLARAYSEEERDVITSAPSLSPRADAVEDETTEIPATRAAPIVASDRDPMLSDPMLSDPVFSLRRAKDVDDDGTDPEIRTTTEPQLRAASPVEDTGRTTAAGIGRPDTPVEPTRPLNRRGASESTQTMPFGSPIGAPRPAAGMPPSPSDLPPARPGAHQMTQPMAAAVAAPLPTMKSASVPPELARQYTSSPPHATASSQRPTAPPDASSTPPPGFGVLAPRPSSPSSPSAAETVQTRSPRSLPPGPVLSDLVKPTRGSTARAAGTIALGILLLGGAGFVVVRQQRPPADARAVVEPAPSAASAAAATVTSAAAPPASAPIASGAPSASGAPIASGAPSAAPPTAPETPTHATAGTSAAVVATAARPVTPRPRPAAARPKPSATAAASSTPGDEPSSSSSSGGASSSGGTTPAPTSTGAAGGDPPTPEPLVPTPVDTTPVPTPPPPTPKEDPSLPSKTD